MSETTCVYIVKPLLPTIHILSFSLGRWINVSRQIIYELLKWEFKELETKREKLPNENVINSCHEDIRL